MMFNTTKQQTRLMALNLGQSETYNFYSAQPQYHYCCHANSL